MAGNSLGQVFRVTTFGESHGIGLGVMIDGCPSRIKLCDDDFGQSMARRKPGKYSFDSPRKEDDDVQIISGVFNGLTTGTPVSLYIKNKDAVSKPYDDVKNIFRPGHADYTYFKKFEHYDYRGGGRASARETAARVAAGVVAGKVLEPLGIRVIAYTLELGGIRAKKVDWEYIEKNPFFCPDSNVIESIEEVLLEAKNSRDSLGGIAEVCITGCPAGLGEPVFDKLDAELAKAIMSIGAVKGIEIGAGFRAAKLKGSENNDPITPNGFRSNNSGGILGGISNGDEIVLRAAIKPIPSIGREQDTVDREGNPVKLNLKGRHDVSAVPRVIPVIEAMVKITLADHYLRYKTLR